MGDTQRSKLYSSGQDASMQERDKPKRGRPARPMPKRIDASPEEIADVVMRMPNKTEWRYIRTASGSEP